MKRLQLDWEFRRCLALRSAGMVMLTLLLALLSACTALRESTAPPAPPTPSVSSLTADEVARAMQEDRLFADYRGRTLQVHGTVASTGQENGEWLLQLRTTGPMKVLCDLGTRPVQFKVGDAITVESSDPQRADSAVLLKACRVD